MDDVETTEFNLNSSRKTTDDIWVLIFLLNTGENLDEGSATVCSCLITPVMSGESLSRTWICVILLWIEVYF